MTITDLIAGDDWELRFTLLDPDGTAYDLTLNPQILWTMVDAPNHRVIESNQVGITVTDAINGKLSVLVPASATTKLRSLVYGHSLRVISAGVAATPFVGQINVLSDPWAIGVSPSIVNIRAQPRAA